MGFLETKDILAKSQGGFRPGHSTNSTVALLVDDIYSSMNNHRIMQSAFIDFSKAFDTIDHSILLRKLQNNYIYPSSIALIDNYLSNRKQQVLVNDKLSKTRNIVCGVPQGSVLGPLLFLIYINDIITFFQDVKIYQYADDTVISTSNETPRQTNKIISQSLQNLELWCNLNKLTINTKKTKVMYFGTTNRLKQFDHFPRTYLYGNELMKVDNHKYLGIILDCNLNYKVHIDTLLKTLRYKLYILSKLRCHLTVQASIAIYKTSILPYIDYGDIFYQAGPKGHLKKVQDKQTKALKICYGLHGILDENIIHTNANLAYLDKRRESHMLNFMYKRQSMGEYIDKKNLATRAYNATKFIIPNYQITHFKTSLLYKGSQLWNQLPTAIKNIDTYSGFKEKNKILV